MTKTKRKVQKKEQQSEENFFEALAASADSYSFTDETVEEPDTAQLAKQQARTTAIITVLLVVLVAVIVSVLFIRGLQTIKDTLPATSGIKQTTTL